MADWPSSLPQDVYVPDDGPTYNQQSNVLRTDMTTGPAKMRRRFTAVPADVTVQIMLSEEEIATLESFVKETLGETGQFNWKKFHTGTAAVYRFKEGWKSVKLKYSGGDLWTVSMDLELMP